jgi:hypothetical protein
MLRLRSTAIAAAATARRLRATSPPPLSRSNFAGSPGESPLQQLSIAVGSHFVWLLLFCRIDALLFMVQQMALPPSY